MKVLLQSLLLLLSFALVFIWTNSPLAEFTVQIIGVLIGMYIVASFAGARRGKKLSFGGAFGIFSLNTIILLFIFATGGMSSSFFFLIYFIIFALVFVFEPYTIVSFCIGTVLLLLPIALRDDVTGNIIKLVSIVLISPLALFFGREYQKSEQDEYEAKGKITENIEIAEKIDEDIEEVIEAEKGKLSKENIRKLKDAVIEADKIKKDEDF